MTEGWHTGASTKTARACSSGVTIPFCHATYARMPSVTSPKGSHWHAATASDGSDAEELGLARDASPRHAHVVCVHARDELMARVLERDAQGPCDAEAGGSHVDDARIAEAEATVRRAVVHRDDLGDHALG